MGRASIPFLTFYPHILGSPILYALELVFLLFPPPWNETRRISIPTSEMLHNSRVEALRLELPVVFSWLGCVFMSDGVFLDCNLLCNLNFSVYDIQSVATIKSFCRM